MADDFYQDDYSADEYAESENYADEEGTIHAEMPPDPSPARRQSRQSPKRRRRMPLVLLIIAIVILIVAVAAWYIAHEPNPTSEFAGTLARDVEPDFTEGLSWPSGVPVTTTTVPALIKHELTFSGEQHGYEFVGHAGETWEISVTARDGSALDPVVSLYQPSGEEIASNDDITSADLNAVLQTTLPQDGAYRLLVESSQGGITTGAYLLSIMPGEPAASP